MSEEETKALWKEIAAISENVKEIKKELKDNFASLPCDGHTVKIAKMEQRLENGTGMAAASRAWIGMAAGWFMTLVGWGIVIVLFLLKK